MFLTIYNDDPLNGNLDLFLPIYFTSIFLFFPHILSHKLVSLVSLCFISPSFSACVLFYTESQY